MSCNILHPNGKPLPGVILYIMTVDKVLIRKCQLHVCTWIVPWWYMFYCNYI